MTANGQSQNQKQRPHRHGTTTTRIGNQPIGFFFNAVLFFMFGTWPNYLSNERKARSPGAAASGVTIKPRLTEALDLSNCGIARFRGKEAPGQSG